MTPTPEKPGFVELNPENRDRQTLAHMSLSPADRRERARLRGARTAWERASAHHCPKTLRPDDAMRACPECGMVTKTIDDYLGGS